MEATQSTGPSTPPQGTAVDGGRTGATSGGDDQRNRPLARHTIFVHYESEVFCVVITVTTQNIKDHSTVKLFFLRIGQVQGAHCLKKLLIAV